MRTFFSLSILLFSFQQAFAQTEEVRFYPEVLVVSVASLNLRSAPEVNAPKVTSLKRGDQLAFIEAVNGGEYVQMDSLWAPWYKVRAGKNTGYVYATYVSGGWTLLFEGEFLETNLPPLHWYGVYKRDSFADVLHPVQVRLEKEYSEFYQSDMTVLKTDRQDTSKFIIGSPTPLSTGSVISNLGNIEISQWYGSGQLFLGSNYAISVGMEVTDTVHYPVYNLVGLGNAYLDDDDFVKIGNFQLFLLEYNSQPAFLQDLTPWVRMAYEEVMPYVTLRWYGDLDGDKKPDMVLEDCPYEMYCRASLFLSSVARPGERLRKAAEHFFPGE